MDEIANCLQSQKIQLWAVMTQEMDACERIPGGTKNDDTIKSMAAICEITEAMGHCAAAINNINGARER